MTDSLKNPYPGINAHLYSRLIAEGLWSDFHINHISDLTRALKQQLAP